MWRCRGEWYNNDCIVEKDRWRGWNLTVWIGISYYQRTAARALRQNERHPVIQWQYFETSRRLYNTCINRLLEPKNVGVLSALSPDLSLI